MGLLLILPILVSGYIFCNGSIYRQATISRYDGQLLYMLIARTGLFLFLLSGLLGFGLIQGSRQGFLGGLGIFHSDCLSYLKGMLTTSGVAEREKATLWAFLAQTSIISFILAWAFPRIFLLLIMLRHQLSPMQAKAFILNFLVPRRPLTRQLLDSMNDGRSQYLFSMNDRKVYVGRVSSVGDLHEAGSMDEDFEIVPIMSGYRDKDTLKVSYTTDYSAVVEEMAARGREIGFSIVLSQKDIVSISRFEHEVWERFKLRQEAESAKKGLFARFVSLLTAVRTLR